MYWYKGIQNISLVSVYWKEGSSNEIYTNTMMRVPVRNLENGTIGHINYFDLCTLWKTWKKECKGKKKKYTFKKKNSEKTKKKTASNFKGWRDREGSDFGYITHHSHFCLTELTLTVLLITSLGVRCLLLTPTFSKNVKDQESICMRDTHFCLSEPKLWDGQLLTLQH